jgi:MFS family permease
VEFETPLTLDNTHSHWYRDPGLRWNVFHGLGLCLVIATNGYGAGLLGGFQAVPQWIDYFGNPKGNLLGLYAASYFLPSIVTSYIGDFISTKFGRRWAVFVGMALMLAGGIVNTFANGVGMWVGGRAIIGSGVGIVKVGAPVLIQEIAHPRLRATLGSCYQGFAYVGGIVASFMCCELRLGSQAYGNWC